MSDFKIVKLLDAININVDNDGILHNLTAATDPGVSDDGIAGYSVGSHWINTATGSVFICTDATNGAAVWSSTAGPGSDTSAIHDDVAGEIDAVSAKATPVAGDKILIEDSADSNNKKKITAGSIDHDALTNFVANEHLDWTQASVGTVHATNYVDNDTTDHTALSNIGTNTHAQIDTHVGSSANPHSVDIDDVTPTTTKGDIIVEDGSNAVSVGVGTDGQVLTANSAITEGVEWAAATGISSPLTTKGDVYTYDTADVRLGIGADGTVLTANSATGTGLEWSVPTGGGGVQLEWKFDTNTSSGDPGSKKFRWNNSTPASVTEVYVNDTTESNADASAILNTLQPGHKIYNQQLDDATKNGLFTVVSVTDETGWFTIVVTADSSGTLLGNNKKCGWLLFSSAAAPTYEVKVSANDTTAGYLEDKIVSADSKLSITTLNDGGDEDVQLAVNEGYIDHDALTNTHNLTTSINHNTITNNHDLTTDIDHNTITNNHNLTTDIDHDQLTNYAANEHFTEASIDHGAIAGLGDDDHGQYILVAGTRDFTGSQNVQDLLPVTTETYDLGSETFRFKDVFGQKAKFINSYVSAGSPTVTRNETMTANASYVLEYESSTTSTGTAVYDVTTGASTKTFVSVDNAANGITSTATVDNTGAGSFTAGHITMSNTSANATAGLYNTGTSSTILGGAGNTGSSATTDARIESSAVGSFASGYSEVRFGSAASTTLLAASGTGSAAIGYPVTLAGGAAIVQATVDGAFAQGQATVIGGGSAGTIQSTGAGASAMGYVSKGVLEATSFGASAFGACLGSANTAKISADARGAFASGCVQSSTGDIVATGLGSLAMGYTTTSSNISASASGAFAFGWSVSGAITASANNCAQWFAGTNNATNTLQVGVAGTGILLYTTGQIDIPGILNHDGTTLGFYSVAPVARPAAYTQTYATATRTHAAATSATLTDSSGGTANTTVAAVSGSGDDATINDNFADLVAQVNALRVDLLNAKQVLNQVIDDDQLQGLKQ